MEFEKFKETFIATVNEYKLIMRLVDKEENLKTIHISERDLFTKMNNSINNVSIMFEELLKEYDKDNNEDKSKFILDAFNRHLANMNTIMNKVKKSKSYMRLNNKVIEDYFI